MRPRDSCNTLEAHRSHLARKASRAAAANDRIIARSLKHFNEEARRKRLLTDFDTTTPTVSEARETVSEAREKLYQVTYICWQLRQHGVPPDAPLLQVKEELALYSRLRESHPSCPARILLRSFKLARRALAAHHRGGVQREHDAAAAREISLHTATERVLKWLLARRKVILVLMAHGRGPPTAAAGVHLSHLPFKVLVTALRQSLY